MLHNEVLSFLLAEEDKLSCIRSTARPPELNSALSRIRRVTDLAVTFLSIRYYGGWKLPDLAPSIALSGCLSTCPACSQLLRSLLSQPQTLPLLCSVTLLRRVSGFGARCRHGSLR